MYLKITNLPSCIQYATEFEMLNDRALLVPYLSYIERYSSDKKCVYGGAVAGELLAELPISMDSYKFEIYADNAYEFSVTLIDELYAHFKNRSPHIPVRSLVLDTLTHTEYTISINTRIITKIVSFGKYRDVDLFSIMQPVTHKGRFSDADIKIIPADLLLIDVYKALYTPQPDNWPRNYNILEKIINVLPQKTGAGDYINVEATVGQAIKYFATVGVFIGDYAIDQDKPPTRLQVIVDRGIDEIVGGLEKYLNKSKVKFAVGKYKLEHVKFYLNLFTDFRLNKYTIYITNAVAKFPIVDVFNSGTYELIPYEETAQCKIAHNLVILRFLLIDMWTLKIIKKSTDSQRYHEILTNFHAIKDRPVKFNLSKYYGIYQSENVAKKQLIKNQSKPKYYPAAEK